MSEEQCAQLTELLDLWRRTAQQAKERARSSTGLNMLRLYIVADTLELAISDLMTVLNPR